jgi:hypothetical protein
MYPAIIAVVIISTLDEILGKDRLPTEASSKRTTFTGITCSQHGEFEAIVVYVVGNAIQNGARYALERGI